MWNGKLLKVNYTYGISLLKEGDTFRVHQEGLGRKGRITEINGVRVDSSFGNRWNEYYTFPMYPDSSTWEVIDEPTSIVSATTTTEKTHGYKLGDWCVTSLDSIKGRLHQVDKVESPEYRGNLPVRLKRVEPDGRTNTEWFTLDTIRLATPAEIEAAFSKTENTKKPCFWEGKLIKVNNPFHVSILKPGDLITVKDSKIITINGVVQKNGDPYYGISWGLPVHNTGVWDVIEDYTTTKATSEWFPKIGDWCYIINQGSSVLEKGKVYRINYVECATSIHFDLNGLNEMYTATWMSHDNVRLATPAERLILSVPNIVTAGSATEGSTPECIQYKPQGTYLEHMAKQVDSGFKLPINPINPSPRLVRDEKVVETPLYKKKKSRIL